ncbi:MAG: hypothetical protein WAQ28_20265 [Bacteroidia bacterium]
MSKPKIQMSNTETEAEREKGTEQQVLNIKSPSMGVYKFKVVKPRNRVEKKRLTANDKRILNTRTTTGANNTDD